MQVINLTDKTLKYYTKGMAIELKPGILTYISEEVTTAKKLKDCYGQRIDIIDETKLEKIYNEFSGNAKPVEPPVKAESEESGLDKADILDMYFGGEDPESGEDFLMAFLGGDEPEVVVPEVKVEPEKKSAKEEKPKASTKKAGTKSKGGRGKKNK